MRLAPLLGRLFSRPDAARRSKRPAKPTRRLRLGTLEDRVVPVRTLYVDMGDFFPTGGLAMTVQQVRDTFANGGIQGPDLRGTYGTAPNQITYADGTNLNFSPLSGVINFDYNGDGPSNALDYTQLKANVLSVVRRIYAPFDVNVELAPALDNTTSATYRQGIVATLQGADVGSAWLLCTTGTNTDANPDTLIGRDIAASGIAPLADIGGNNTQSNSALVFADYMLTPNLFFNGISPRGADADTALGDNICHEAGHAFGMQHIFDTQNQRTVTLANSDQMGYGLSWTQYGLFSRYPLISDYVLGSNPLQRPGPAVIDYDRLADGDLLGVHPGAPAYVTGTGAFDTITITASGANTAQVSIATFSDANHTTALNVPGGNATYIGHDGATPTIYTASGNVFTYTVDTSNGILIDAGENTDWIVVDANIAAHVTVRGNPGNNRLEILGNGAVSGYYLPNSTVVPSLVTRNPDATAAPTNLGGFVSVGGTTVSFQDYTSNGQMYVHNVTDFTYYTPNSQDAITVDSPQAGRQRISGTSSGVQAVPLVFDNLANLVINTGWNDGSGSGDDLVRLAGNALATGLRSITLDTGDGNDAVTIDLSDVLYSLTNGIRYDGGTGVNSLSLVQTGGAAQTSDTYRVGPNPGEGTSTIVGPTGTQTVYFQQLAPVIDTVAAANLFVVGTPESNVINYTQGSAATRGKVTIDNYELIEFSNKPELTIQALAGNDLVNLNNGSTPGGLTRVNVDAGDGEDVVTTLAGLPTDVTFNGGDGNDYLSAAGAAGDANLNGGTGNDILIGGTGDDALSGGAGEDTLDARGGSNSLDGGADADTILVSGTSGPDMIAMTHGAGTFDVTGGLSAGTNTITGVEAVRVEAGGGADDITLNLSADGGLDYTVLGGNPIGTLLGDSLTVNSSAVMTVTAGPENDAGSVDAATTTPTNVSFDEIELLILSGGGGGVINGTNGDDAITVIARDKSFNPAADGIQDFTGVVNAGLEVLYLNQPTLTVNALGGSDTIVLRTPAPNNAKWDVDVTVDGGPPSAGDPGGSDRLVVETPGTDVAETADYTPTAADAGTLNLTSLDSLITMKQIEELLYDGEADNDSLKVLGTDGDDAITHTPGIADQAGTFQVNGLLPISYQNMGSGAALTADGGDGSDTLISMGTNANDTFTVLNAAGDVRLNSRLVLSTTGIETLTMEGLLGDDLFDIVPAVPSLVYGQVNANGGAQASAAGDQTNLKGTAAPDSIAVSGQVVSMGGVTVASSGVENINLNSGGGVPPDLLTYTGVPGVTEAISLAGSSTAGTGVLSVPGVVNLNFVGTETFMVNGDPADGDTLTVVGTNAVDRFRVNLAAAGTSGDPVLKMLNAAGTLVKLTLLNYTGFNVLNVDALDGNDVVNVFTAATGPSRNVFVDGGLPTGKNKGTDILNVYYAGRRPRIVHSAATQNPDSGLVTLDYGTAFCGVQYESMEDVNILKS